MTNGQDSEAQRSDAAAGIDADDLESDAVPGPHPDRSPENVLKTVLAALKNNDAPHENAGIRTAFNFSSPVYRRQTGGSFEEFRDHMNDPIHRTLVDFADSERGRLQVEDDEATEKVVVTDHDGESVTYEFTMLKVDRGKYEGCWMIHQVDLVYVGASPDHQHMPVVEFDGLEVKCKEGEILRDALLRASGVSPYNNAAQYANCGGNGLCGTCGVEILEGEVTEKTPKEKRRLNLPPVDDVETDNVFRLSCQCRVVGDLKVHKHEGTWGQHVEEYVEGTDEEVDYDPIRVTDEEYQDAEDLDEMEEMFEEEEDDEDDGRSDLDLSEETQSLLDETEDILRDDE